MFPPLLLKRYSYGMLDLLKFTYPCCLIVVFKFKAQVLVEGVEYKESPLILG